MIKFVLRIIALSILFAILGLVFGALMALILNPKSFVRWKSLGYPTEEVVSDIIGADETTVFVQTQSGKIYRCCWLQASEFTQVPSYNLEYNDFPFEISRPPGEATDGIEVVHNYVEGVFTQKYILVQDGSVWLWEYAWDPYTALDRYARFALIGSLIGFISGIAIAVLTHLRPVVKTTNDPREG